MTPEPRRVAVLGGTFDPVHSGHLALVTGARDAIGATEAWLLPARAPALRAEPIAPAQLRLAMLEAAVRGTPHVRVVDIELRRRGVSHTIDTLEGLRISDPEVVPWWILGADAARHLHQWHRSEDLLDILHLVVAQRAGERRFDVAEARSLRLAAERTVVLELTPPPVSASQVRRRVASGEPISGLVPAAVADIIAASGLYRGAADAIMRADDA
ncbi:MAG: nicotinate (nicotinamide) nucleotide adenylyltransferase [Candidatus Dormibacteria bacterium]